MSFDLYVLTDADREITTPLLIDNMEAFRWQIRFLNRDDVVVSELSQAVAIMAWDVTYEPAPEFAKRYIPGVKVDFDQLPEEEAVFIGVCGLEMTVSNPNGWLEDIQEELGEDSYKRFVEGLGESPIRVYHFRTGGSSHHYRFVLQRDLAVLCAWMTEGILSNPQEGESALMEGDLSVPELTPLERAQQSLQELEDIMEDPERRAALIAEWLNR
ncbi:MAG: hypothetical protein ACYDCO_12410 [Armatimonadota bacterium]